MGYKKTAKLGYGGSAVPRLPRGKGKSGFSFPLEDMKDANTMMVLYKGASHGVAVKGTVAVEGVDVKVDKETSEAVKEGCARKLRELGWTGVEVQVVPQPKNIEDKKGEELFSAFWQTV